MCMSAVLVTCFDIFLVQNRSLHFLAMDEPEELHEHVPLKKKLLTDCTENAKSTNLCDHSYS